MDQVDQVDPLGHYCTLPASDLPIPIGYAKLSDGFAEALLNEYTCGSRPYE